MKYLVPLKDSFFKNANATHAAGMKKYMRNQFDFIGLKAPIRRELGRQFIKEHGLPGVDSIVDIIKELWNRKEREFQFFAMDLLSKFKKKTDASAINLYEFLITNKSWWDTVDFIAASLAADHFIRFPEQIMPRTQKWMVSGHMWLQRSALLFQLKYKKATNFHLLSDYIIQLMDSEEFFIRKAIGWTLREFSKTDPGSVIDFVDTYEEQLSGLSKREALKVIERNNKK